MSEQQVGGLPTLHVAATPLHVIANEVYDERTGPPVDPDKAQAT